MPAYNCEKTIYRAITGILEQTFVEYELIIVDDGSTDNTIEICENFARQDKRISIYKAAHGGVSMARNLGISVAKAENILFIDSDDSWEPELLWECDKAIKEYDAVIFGVSHILVDENDNVVSREDGKALPQQAPEEVVLDNNFDSFISSYNVAAPWNKVYKREIIEKNKIRFW